MNFDVHGCVHHNTNLTKMTNKMQLCRTIYYSILPWLLNIIADYQEHLNCKYSLEAPDVKR
jgi:hypothetical protein